MEKFIRVSKNKPHTNIKQTRKQITKENKKRRKIERIMLREEATEWANQGNYGTPLEDVVEQWAHEDDIEAEFEAMEKDKFLEEVSGIGHIYEQARRSVSMHYEQRIGRWIDSICEGNNAEGKTTIIVIRGSYRDVYRISCRRDAERKTISELVAKGHSLSQVNIYKPLGG